MAPCSDHLIATGAAELLYYGVDATFLGDTVNRTGLFTSVAGGDFDGDGDEEIVAARYVAATPESDLYYYEFGASNLYFDTRNRLVRYNEVAAGNFDADPVSEVVVARQSGSGVVGDLYETELLFFQPGELHPYLDSTNDDGRFIALATGNLNADAKDEVAVVKLHEDGLAGQVESEFWIADTDFLIANGDPRNVLVMDLTPNRNWDLTGVAVGSFNNGATAANIVVTSDRRTAATPETSRAELFAGDTDAATVSFAFNQVPKRSEGMVDIAAANLDGDAVDDFAIILNYDDGGTTYATVEIYHGDGVSKDPSTVEYLLKMNAQAVSVDTGDLDQDGLDEIVVLYDLLNGTSQIVTYDVDANFDLAVLSTGAAFNGTGTDVAVVLPEPAMLAILALGGLTLIRRRRT